MKKTILFFAFANVVLANGGNKFPINLALDLEYNINKNVKAKYGIDATIQNPNIYKHKFSLENSNILLAARINHKSSLESFGFDVETKLDKKNFELKNTIKFDYAADRYILDDIALDKDDSIFVDEVEGKYKNEDIEISAGAFVRYFKRNNMKNEVSKHIERESTIPENHIRLHFGKDLGEEKDIKEKGRGLWLWGFVEKPSDSNNGGYPKNKTKFDMTKKDEYGYYLDIEKRKSACPIGPDMKKDNNCEKNILGFLVVDGETKNSDSEKFEGKQDSEINVLNNGHKEVWIKLTDKGSGNKEWISHNYDPDYMKNVNEYYKTYHEIKKTYWENEEKIARIKNDNEDKKILLEDRKEHQNHLDKFVNTTISEVLNYGFNFGLKYKGVKNASLGAKLKAQNFVYMNTKDNSWRVDLSLNAKYDYVINKLTVTPELDVLAVFKNIQKANAINELFLIPKLALRYDFNKNFNMKAKLEASINFNDHRGKFDYSGTVVRPSFNVEYIW